MVPKPHLAPIVAPDEVVDANRTACEADLAPNRNKWRARHDLDRYRAETERLRVLADFLARPIHAHGGCEPDPDIVTAYNLAVEAALQGIRRAACSD